MVRNAMTMFENDRYIINRNSIDFDKSHLMLNTKSPDKMKKLALLTNLNTVNTDGTKVLRSKTNTVEDNHQDWTDAKKTTKAVKTSHRRINRYPIDMLQVYDASTNFFHNTLHLSSRKMNAIALNNYVFLWDLNTNTYLSYERNRTTPLTALCWNQDGSQLATCKKHYLDMLGGPSRDTLVRRIPMDYTYYSLDWRSDMVTCGSTRSVVPSYDLRENNDRPAIVVCPGSKEKNNNPVVSVRWNPNGRYLATSDPLNSINVWDILNLKTPLTTFKEHKSTVKGLAWCPYEGGTLASGGGYFDGKVYVWKCNNGKVISSACLNSQITGLLWSEVDKELLTAHARKVQPNEEDKFFHSKIMFWKYHSANKSTSHLQKLNHSLCNTDEIINVTNNGQFFLALCGFDCPKLCLWKNIFTKVPNRLLKSELTDPTKFK